MKKINISILRNDYLSIYVNSFVLQTKSHIICIDSGLYGYKKQLERYLKDGKKTLLFSTHGHWDHVGLHKYIQQRGGLILAHPGDERYYSDHKWHWDILFGQFENDFVLPKERRETYYSQIGLPVTIDYIIRDEQTIAVDDLIFQVIHTPGHSNGSVCIMELSSGMLFTGDTLMGDGFFAGIPQYSDFKSYINSMERLCQINPSVIYSNHNPPIEGNQLEEIAQRSISCAKRIDMAVNDFIFANRNMKKINLGEVVSYVCRKEGKSISAGACVTVLTHLCSLRKGYSAVDNCVRQYIFD